jgi:hypothetical protein
MERGKDEGRRRQREEGLFVIYLLFFIISFVLFSPGLLPTLDPLTGPKAGVGGFPLNYTYPPFLALHERLRG